MLRSRGGGASEGYTAADDDLRLRAALAQVEEGGGDVSMQVERATLIERLHVLRLGFSGPFVCAVSTRPLVSLARRSCC